MIALRVAAAVALVACVPSSRITRGQEPDEPMPDGWHRPGAGEKWFGPPISPGQFPAPVATSEPRCWKVGQWAVYQRRHGNAAGRESVRVVAQDGCGYWIEYELGISGHQWSWLYCVSAVPNPDDVRLADLLGAVIEHRDGQLVAIEDFHRNWANRDRYEWLVALVRASWPGHPELPHEDITTLGGTFDGAIKLTAKTASGESTRWSHPAVVLGGVVKEVSGSEERSLLAQGVASTPTPIFDAEITLAAREQQQRLLGERPASWIGVQLGFDGFGTPADVDPTSGLAFAEGLRVAPRLDVVADFSASGTASYHADPMLDEEMVVITAGARWHPFGRARMPPRFGGLTATAIYVQGELGYAELSRGGEAMVDTVGRGIAAGARLGWAALQGRDWICGIELHDHFALLNADEGLRHSVGVQAFIQLFLPWWATSGR